MTAMTSVGSRHMTNCQRMKVERYPSENQKLVLVEEVTELELKSDYLGGALLKQWLIGAKVLMIWLSLDSDCGGGDDGGVSVYVSCEGLEGCDNVVWMGEGGQSEDVMEWETDYCRMSAGWGKVGRVKM